MLRLLIRCLFVALALFGAEGGWAQPDALREEQRAEIARLEALGYLAGTARGGDRRGVTVHDPARAHQGLNFFVSGHGAGAELVDMSGKVLHRWSRRFDEIWPRRKQQLLDTTSSAHYWRRAFPQPNGDVLVIFEGLGLARLSRSSELVWRKSIRAHHDLEVMPSGDLALLARRARLMPTIDRERPTLDDFVVILGPDGKEHLRVSVIGALARSRYAWMLDHRRIHTGDILHTNGLQVLYETPSQRNAAFAAGRILLSIRELDALAVLDLKAREIVWAHQGSFALQHDPRIVSDGNVMLFDNSGLGLESRVLELDPSDGRIVWSYRGPEGALYYSDCCGTARRLPNGNTLINEATLGRSFEVTREGDVVWEFYNPHRLRVSVDGPETVTARLFDLIRLPVDFGSGWLAKSQQPAPQDVAR